MNVLVAYATHHGATRQIAERIGATLAQSGLHVSVEQVDRTRDIAGYEAFVIGSALYCGWLKEATEFVRRNKATLAGRPLWLFSSGPLGVAATDRVVTLARPRFRRRSLSWVTPSAPETITSFFGAVRSGSEAGRLPRAHLQAGAQRQQRAPDGRLPRLGRHRGMGGGDRRRAGDRSNGRLINQKEVTE